MRIVVSREMKKKWSNISNDDFVDSVNIYYINRYL